VHQHAVWLYGVYLKLHEPEQFAPLQFEAEQYVPFGGLQLQ
jgi:hypothetical protein